MPLTTEQIQQLHEALDREEPSAWRFEEDGLRVTGVPRRLEDFEDTEFGDTRFLVLEVEGRERRILLTTVLERKLKRMHVRAGEPVGIERDAELTRPKDGKPYWDYKVRRIEDSQPRELDWQAKGALPETIDAEVVYSDSDAPPEYEEQGAS